MNAQFTKQTIELTAVAMLQVANAESAFDFLNGLCAEHIGYNIPAFNSKDRKDEAAAWKAAFLKAGAKQASLSNLRVALNYGFEAGRFLGANSARAKEALAALKKQGTEKPATEPKERGTKERSNKTDKEKLIALLGKVAASKALPDFQALFTDDEWSAFTLAVEAMTGKSI